MTDRYPGKGSAIAIMALLPVIFLIAIVIGAGEYLLAWLKRVVYGPDA